MSLPAPDPAPDPAPAVPVESPDPPAPALHAAPDDRPSVRPAELGVRASAYFVDWAIGAIIAFAGAAIIGLAAGQGMVVPALIVVFTLALAVVLLAYLALYLMLLGRGASWGMRAMKISLVLDDELTAPGFAAASLRALLFWAGSAIVVGPFSPLFDRSGKLQGWHDEFTHTMVVEGPVEEQPGAPTLENHIALTAEGLLEESGGVAVAPSSSDEERYAPTGFEAVLAEPAARAVLPPGIPPMPPGFPLPEAQGEASAARVGSRDASWAPPPLPPVLDTRTRFEIAGYDSAGFDSSGFSGVDQTVIRVATAVVIRLDSGEAHPIAGAAVVGRRPSALADEPTDQLIAVDDPTKSISKTHLSVRNEGGRLWIVDRNSTNGTRVLRADGSRIAVSGPEPVLVRPGDRVGFGDRFFTVEPNA